MHTTNPYNSFLETALHYKPDDDDFWTVDGRITMISSVEWPEVGEAFIFETIETRNGKTRKSLRFGIYSYQKNCGALSKTFIYQYPHQESEFPYYSLITGFWEEGGQHKIEVKSKNDQYKTVSLWV